jgi:APA family basic amino acid/polyamine antiporter
MEKSTKKLGLCSLISLVAGNMIGSGIFLLPSNLGQLGSLSLLGWIFTTLGTMFIALVFCRISTIVTKTGGPYAYAQIGLGNVLGFQTAYCYWIAIWVGNAAIALTGVSYLSVFFPVLSDPFVACMVTIFFVWLFTFINLLGMNSIGAALNVLTVLKLLPIFLVGIFGWFFFHLEYITEAVNITSPRLSNFSVITQAATLTLWAFIGVESATVPSESVENPKRNIPLATLIGSGIAAVAYILSSTVIMGISPSEVLKVSVSPFADAAQVIFGSWGKWIVAIGAAISCFGCLHGWILLQGQIPMAAAKDGLFLKVFGRINKHGVPGFGVVITSVFISLLLFFTISPDLVNQFKTIILIATLANLIPYLYTPVAELIIKNFCLSKREFAIALLAIIYSFWAISGAGQDVLALGALLVMSSIPLYLFVSKKESHLE